MEKYFAGFIISICVTIICVGGLLADTHVIVLPLHRDLLSAPE